MATSTREITRGAMRLLSELGYAAMPEVSLTNNRRADIVGLDKRGGVILVEVKSCLADFRSDTKWQDYLGYAEEFYFAVDDNFPREVFDEPSSLPDVTGIILADRYGGDVIRPATPKSLNAARRKALTLTMARSAAQRLSGSQTAVGGIQGRSAPSVRLL